MANSTVGRGMNKVGYEGRDVFLGVKAAAKIFAGTMVAQIAGACVAGTTATAGPCIGVAQHDMDATGAADLVKRVALEFDRVYAFDNSVTDACSETLAFDTAVFMEDDHTISRTNGGVAARQYAGRFRGMEPNGTVRVYIAASNAT
ncbi:MAG TPA: hypothetical protein VNJ04_05205 [Gemmatimonadaceae bacterium]|nr:hypothetical protein [Gemmatimonadaceae bacterium]